MRMRHEGLNDRRITSRSPEHEKHIHRQKGEGKSKEMERGMVDKEEG